MKYQKGEWVLCGDPDIGDKYAGVVARDLPEWALAENPVCRIKEVRRYPIQHAVIWADVAHECPPLRFGGLYCLRVYAHIRAGAGTEEAYRESLEAAIRSALDACASDAEKGILMRHLAGKIGGGRGIKAWKEWEL